MPIGKIKFHGCSIFQNNSLIQFAYFKSNKTDKLIIAKITADVFLKKTLCIFFISFTP